MKKIERRAARWTVNNFDNRSSVTALHPNYLLIGIKNQIPKNEKQKIQYRSFRSVDTDALNMDRKTVRITGSDQDEKFNFHSVYENFETDIKDVFDKHIPIKERYAQNNQLPYMNRTLRKAIYNKKMVYHKYLKNKLRSFKSKENIHKKEVGPYHGFGY